MKVRDLIEVLVPKTKLHLCGEHLKPADMRLPIEPVSIEEKNRWDHGLAPQRIEDMTILKIAATIGAAGPAITVLLADPNDETDSAPEEPIQT